MVCRIAECEKVTERPAGHGMCSMHYTRQRRHGHPETVLRTGANGSANGSWKGNDVGYVAMHARVRRHRGAPGMCSFDPEHAGPYEWALDHAEASEVRTVVYQGRKAPISTDVNDYVSLCVGCHREFDDHPFMKGGVD